MKIELSKEDLINMVNGVSPSYDLFEDKRVKGYGDYNGSYGTWSWRNHELRKLSLTQLFHLYELCRDCYKD